MLFIAIMFNYADRIVWSITAPAFAYAFHWTPSISAYGEKTNPALSYYGLILFAWSLAYAFFNFPGGWLVDKLAVRKSMTSMFAVWSAFTALTAASFNFISMLIIRVFMGAGEGPVWPINSKLVKNWANRFDESKAFTLAGAGQAVGPVVGAVVGGALYALYGWPAPFIFFGVLGLILSAVWYFMVRDNPFIDKRVNKEELDYITEGKKEHEKSEKTLSTREIWSNSAKMVFGTQAGLGTLLVFISFGYILFTFLYWLPPLMFSTFAHSVTKSAYYTAAIDVALLAGFLGSGPFNDGLLRKFEKTTARRMGAIIPMVIMIAAVGLSYFTGTAKMLVPTALLLALGAGVMNLTVGSWAVNAIDLAPEGTSATVYGIYNGALNVMGAFNGLIEPALFIKVGPVGGFASSVFFMALFLGGYLVLIRKNSWDKAMALKDSLVRKVEAQ